MNKAFTQIQALAAQLADTSHGISYVEIDRARLRSDNPLTVRIWCRTYAALHEIAGGAPEDLEYQPGAVSGWVVVTVVAQGAYLRATVHSWEPEFEALKASAVAQAAHVLRAQAALMEAQA